MGEIRVSGIATIRKNYCNTAPSPLDFQKRIRLQEANMSYKTATRRRRRRLLTSDTKAHRNSAANTRGCLACRLKFIAKFYALAWRRKFILVWLKFHKTSRAIHAPNLGKI